MRQSVFFLLVLVALSLVFSVASAAAAKPAPATAHEVNERIKTLCGEKCHSEEACIRRCYNYVLGRLPDIAKTLMQVPGDDYGNTHRTTRGVGTPNTSTGSSSTYRYTSGK